MGDTALNKPAWMVARWVKYLGMPGVAGVALLVLAAGVLLGFILPAQAQLARATSAAADLQNRHQMALANHTARALPAEPGLTAFYKLLPPEQSAVRLLEKIYQTADKESLRLTQAEYKFTRGKAGHLGSYQVSLPVRGSYIQVRKFIAKVMNTLPTVALDGISFSRESIGGAELEARIQFTIFLGIV